MRNHPSEVLASRLNPRKMMVIWKTPLTIWPNWNISLTYVSLKLATIWVFHPYKIATFLLFHPYKNWAMFNKTMITKKFKNQIYILMRKNYIFQSPLKKQRSWARWWFNAPKVAYKSLHIFYRMFLLVKNIQKLCSKLTGMTLKKYCFLQNIRLGYKFTVCIPLLLYKIHRPLEGKQKENSLKSAL